MIYAYNDVTRKEMKTTVVEPSTSEAVTTPSAPKPPSSPVKKAALLWMGVLLGVLVVVLGGLLIAKWANNRKPAFTIENKSYSKQQYQSMIDSAKKHNVSEAEARAKYIEIEKKRYVAESMGIKATDYQMYRAASEVNSSKNSKDFDEWEKELAYVGSLPGAIEAGKKGGYSGAIFYFPYSRLMEPLSGAYKGKQPAGYRDPAKIEEDRVYADGKAKEYYQKIKDGYSEADAVRELQADKKLFFTGAANSSKPFQVFVDNGVVMQQDTGNAQQRYRDIDASSLKGKDSVGLSELQTGKVVLIDLPGAPQKDGYYYFYKIDQYREPGQDLKKKFDTKYNSLEVTTNV